VKLKQAEITHIDHQLNLFPEYFAQTIKFLTYETSSAYFLKAFETPDSMMGLLFSLSDEKQLYYRKVYGFFEFMEDYGGISGSL